MASIPVRVRLRRLAYPLTFAALALASLALVPRRALQEWRVIDERMHHLGNDATPKWSEAPEQPEAAPLEIAFQAHRNAAEWLLEVAGRDVDGDWALELNGQPFARLKRINDETRVGRYPVPAEILKNGKNVLVVRALSDPDDDMLVGRVRLIESSLREVERLGRLEVSVTERGSQQPLPAKITVVDERGNPAELYYADSPTTAVRPGIAYTSQGKATLELPEGNWRVWASRGMEWSADSSAVATSYRGQAKVELALAREVDTRGWVAADTHIHTLTHSGHGDASVEERLLTLAGEGIELPIATDHNHQTDYRPLQRQMNLSAHFTPVVGNEVTTENGHMNAFPLDPAKPIPAYEELDWKKLVTGIRARGAQVVILNHPRWPEEGKDPLTKFGFDEGTGQNAAGQEFTFDCIELVNSDCPTAPTDMVLPVWYALLESGRRFTAVGASDSHTVGVVVGQGRTYVPSRTDDPARIDVEAACKSFLEGRVSVSLGMLASIEIDGRGMGDTLTSQADEVEATVSIRHPSWVTPRKLEMVVNGRVAATIALDELGPGDGPNLRQRKIRVPVPSATLRKKSWIVALARGDRVEAPFWPMSAPQSLAITNPVYIQR